jgi:hypothetical protein
MKRNVMITSTAKWRFCTPARSAMIVARSLKCVANHTRAWDESAMLQIVHAPHTLLDTKASAIASAIASPSRVLVPLPSSSTIALHIGQFEAHVRELQVM